MRDKTYISFDWALKRLLRDKANFGVLEGFISTLLDRSVKIHRLLESEGNKDRDDAKQNRVDLLAEDADGELLLVEVQGESEYAYFQRILFGASKLVTEYIDSGKNYENVKRYIASTLSISTSDKVRTLFIADAPSFMVSITTMCCSFLRSSSRNSAWMLSTSYSRNILS